MLLRQVNEEVVAEAADDVEALRQKVAVLRREMKLTQVSVASDLGVSQSKISGVESGHLTLPLELCAKLLRLYGYKLVAVRDAS